MLRRWFDDQDFIAVFKFFSMFHKSWKYGKDLFACFVDLGKVQYDCVSNSGEFCRRLELMVSCYKNRTVERTKNQCYSIFDF